jgi:hypothetical protein
VGRMVAPVEPPGPYYPGTLASSPVTGTPHGHRQATSRPGSPGAVRGHNRWVPRGRQVPMLPTLEKEDEL